MNEDVERVLSAIKAAGGQPMLVGGYVRDLMMGKESKDIDIEVFHIDSIELHAALKKVAMVKEVGRSFGVFKIHTGSTDMDVSLPRTDSKVGPGHTGFEVIHDPYIGLREASARRDFTLNAIMLDPETGRVIDLHGGTEDLYMGILRHTSEAFGDDPLRVMRAIQFVARFGFTIAEQTKIKCMELKPHFSELSQERIWTEWEKIGTRGTHFVRMFQALDDTDWTGCFPETVLMTGYTTDVVARRCDAQGISGEKRLIVVFATMLDGLGTELVRSFLERIGCPEHIIRRIVPLVENIDGFYEALTPANVRTLARKLHPSCIDDLLMIEPSPNWTAAAFEEGVIFGPQQPFLRGDHLIERGFKPGPIFKTILRAAQEEQDQGNINSTEDALAWLSEVWYG
jgi:tRNA nucleotidyltransferase (CCA-adding enzyme)